MRHLEGTRTDRVKVLVADPQRLFCEALAIALRQIPAFDVIAEYPTTGSEACSVHARDHPDVVLLDYWMAGQDGPTTTRAIHAHRPGTKVLLLSWMHGPHHIRQALESGAVGFLPKALPVAQVIEAVRRAHQGEPLVFAAELARLVDAIEDRLVAAIDQSKRLARLSPREREVLHLVSQGLSTSDVSDELNINHGTTKNHIHRILTKLNVHSLLEALVIARHNSFIGDTFPASTNRMVTYPSSDD